MKFTIAHTEEHFDIIRTMLREYAEWMEYELCFDSFEKELAGLSDRYVLPSGLFYIAEVENEPVGCIALSRVDDTTCKMKRLWVRQQYRGQRYGHQLTVKFIDEAKRLGYGKICLYTTKRMDVARPMYQRFGFVVKKIEELPDDYIYMELEL